MMDGQHAEALNMQLTGEFLPFVNILSREDFSEILVRESYENFSHNDLINSRVKIVNCYFRNKTNCGFENKTL